MTKFCCPNCGNTELQVINETDIQTTGKNYSATQGCLGYLLMGPFGLLCGSCGSGQKTTSTNTNYWVCPKCGKKFRSPDDLRKEMQEVSTRAGVLSCITGLLCAIITLPLHKSEVGSKDAFFIMLAISIISVIIGVIAYNVIKKQKESEITELELGMKKFLGGNTGLFNTPQNIQYNQTSNFNQPYNQAANTQSHYPQRYNNPQINEAVNQPPVNQEPYINQQPYNQAPAYVQTTQQPSTQQSNNNQYVTQQPVQDNSSRIPTASEWKCPKCGVINQNYVGTCGCGEQKPR